MDLLLLPIAGNGSLAYGEEAWTGGEEDSDWERGEALVGPDARRWEGCASELVGAFDSL